MTAPCVIAGINWVNVSEALLAGGITLAITLIAILLRDKQQRKRDAEKDAKDEQRSREFEAKVAELGVARGAAVKIRNTGEQGSLSGKALQDWLASAKDAERKMVDRASAVSEASGSLVDWQDRPPGLPYSSIQDPAQRKMLRNLSGAIIKAEMVIIMAHNPAVL